jgi:hypothetical protein
MTAGACQGGHWFQVLVLKREFPDYYYNGAGHWQSHLRALKPLVPQNRNQAIVAWG